MWTPGTLLHLHRGSYDLFYISRYDKRPVLCIVVSLREIRYSTKGPVYYVIFFGENRFYALELTADIADKHFTVHKSMTNHE